MTNEQLFDYIYAQCPDKECEKRFYVINENGVQNCKCMTKLTQYKRYSDANIPLEFWEFTTEDIDPEFDKNILKNYKFFKNNIEKCILNKVQFWFTGHNGLGKTTISLLMLKDVLDSGYKGLIINAFELITMLYKDRENELHDYDFIVVDEFDKLKKSTIDDFSNIVCSYMDKKSVILSGNKNIKQLEETGYPDFFLDRLEMFTKFEFKGKSFRKQIMSKFETLMKTQEND